MAVKVDVTRKAEVCRLFESKDVASGTVFLASEESSFITV
jgi:hypothetical protein